MRKTSNDAFAELYGRAQFPEKPLQLKEIYDIVSRHAARLTLQRLQTAHSTAKQSQVFVGGECALCGEDTCNLWNDDYSQSDAYRVPVACCFCKMTWHPECSYQFWKAVHSNVNDFPSTDAKRNLERVIGNDYVGSTASSSSTSTSNLSLNCVWFHWKDAALLPALQLEFGH